MPETESTHKSPKLLIDAEFSDPETVAQTIGWNQDFLQLEAGKLEASIKAIGHQDCQLIRVYFNRSLHQLGKPPEDIVAFGFPDPDNYTMRLSGTGLPANLLVNFNTGGGLDITSKGPMSGTILSFKAERFWDCLEVLGFDECLRKTIQAEPFWVLNEEDARDLKLLINMVFSAESGEDTEALLEYGESFKSGLATMVLRFISDSSAPQLKPQGSRNKVLSRALDHLDSSQLKVLSIEDICVAIGTSYSTLERAFKEEFGVAPQVYLRSRRLSGARKDLISTDGRKLIAEIAHDWGFWHMSAFAADYRKQFGELPSETKSRAAHQ